MCVPYRVLFLQDKEHLRSEYSFGVSRSFTQETLTCLSVSWLIETLVFVLPSSWFLSISYSSDSISPLSFLLTFLSTDSCSMDMWPASEDGVTDSVGGGVKVTQTPGECRELSFRPLLPVDVDLLVDVVDLSLLQDVVVCLVDLLVDVVGVLLLQDVAVNQWRM